MTDDTIINDWEGSVGGKSRAVGFDVWRFDSEGRIIEHEMRTFLNVKDATGPGAQLRVLLASPRMAIGFLQAKRKG